MPPLTPRNRPGLPAPGRHSFDGICRQRGPGGLGVANRRRGRGWPVQGARQPTISSRARRKSASVCSRRPMARSQNSASRGAGAGDGQDQRQGGLAFAEVVAGVLAQGLGHAAVIQRVVGQLEGQAKVQAVFAQGRHTGRARIGRHRTGLGRGREQFGRLGFDDFQIECAGRELRSCALVSCSTSPSEITLESTWHEDVQRLQRSGLDHQLEGSREQEIAHQDAGGAAPDEVRGDLAAPELRAVHHVVVEQGGGVDELHRRGQLRTGVVRWRPPAAPAATVKRGRSRLPPAAIRCSASAGITGTGLSSRSAISPSTPPMSTWARRAKAATEPLGVVAMAWAASKGGGSCASQRPGSGEEFNGRGLIGRRGAIVAGTMVAG